MTKEQEEAIEYFKKNINYFKEQIKFIEAVGSDYYDEEYELYKNRVKQFETVLSMLKEKDEKIEYYKKQKDYDDQFKHELLEQIRCLNLDNDKKDKELEKKDKIIDLNKKRFGKENNRSRKIEQYDLNGNFIRTWDTIKQAADELKTNTANIIACCQGKYKKSHGFIWRYKE